MNKKLIAAAMACTAILALAGKKSDPVLMTIDGQDIRLSEFEYLYKKNNMQQADPVTFDQYVDMFVDYKLKVADARAAGIDTTQAFKAELAKYCDDLAMPYMQDKETQEALVQKVYDRMGEEVYVSHIMFQMPFQNPDAEQLADSVLNLLKNGEITFEDAAARYSIDRASQRNGGKMGWVTANGRYPWEFEEAAFDTPVGGLSPIVNSGYGLHIIRCDERRPALGEVNAQHILLLTQNVTDPAQKDEIKARIDSLYAVVTTPGVNFDDIAKQYSQDPGSASRGGRLDWFGPGMMVPEFENVAFSLADGEISEPFATSYGYHIVRKIGHRGGADKPALDDVRGIIEGHIGIDSRSVLAHKAYLNKFATKTNSSKNPALDNFAKDFFASRGIKALDQEAIAAARSIDTPAYTVNGKTVALGQLLLPAPLQEGTNVAEFGRIVANAINASYYDDLRELAKEDLANTNTDYRNLLNEYRDGIMLFEISNQKVWNRGNEAPEELEAYFMAHRDKYSWDKPRYKAYVIFATSDSIADEAQAYLNEHYSSRPIDSKALIADLKKIWGKNIKIERVLAAQGENAYTDYLAFGGKRPETDLTRWPAFFAFDGKILEQPEEAIDARGAVTADFQADLEKDWLARLHASYPVKLNKKAIEKAKKENK